jgi:hypothetical protein
MIAVRNVIILKNGGKWLVIALAQDGAVRKVKNMKNGGHV